MVGKDLRNFILEKIREIKTLHRKYTHPEGEPLTKRSAFFPLKENINKFLAGDKKKRFLVMPGLRGTGKTTLLMQLYRYLVKSKDIKNRNILYLSTDELVSSFADKGLLDAIRAYYKVVHENTIAETKKQTFLFIDEAHFDENWDTALKVVYDKSSNVFILATGSSALSLTIGTDTVRRAEMFPLFPLNYQKFLFMKHKIKPPKLTAKLVRKCIFTGSDREVEKLEKNYNKIKTSLTKLKRPPSIEFKNYLKYGGLPYSIKLEEKDSIVGRTKRIMDRIISYDLATIGSFKQENIPKIKLLVNFLAFKKPGKLSIRNLASHIRKSADFVESVLDSLEKAGVLFSCMAYGGAGRTTRKPLRYYFATPTLKFVLMKKKGMWDEENLGGLLEHLVASSLFRMKKVERIKFSPQNIFFDSRKGGADFLVKFGEKIIPIEVGIGKKKVGQVKKSMERFDSSHGILISKGEVEKKEDIIMIPPELFGFA